jgi:hypothetical protein
MNNCVCFLKEFSERGRAFVRADMAFYLFIGAYTLACALFLELVGASDQAAFSVYLSRWPFMFALFLPAIALLADAAMLAFRFRRRPRLAAMRVFSAARLARLVAGVALLMAFGVFQGDYTSIKNALPFWRGGFPYDQTQARLDAFIHFGTDPWRYLHAVAGFDIVRTIIEWNYNVLWFLICFGALFFVTTSPLAASVRTRYLVCFSAVWVLIGNVLAGIFLSAGPAFYGFVTGDIARYGEQLAFLARSAASPNSATAYQDYLWKLHEMGQAGFASGISAFPSVHVGLITLNALFLYEYRRKLGLAGFAYAAFVAASSVFLAWHYAIDGYASMVMTVLIYIAVRKWAAVRKTSGEPAPTVVVAGPAYDGTQASPR